jgi:hypothetical protein
MEATAGLSLTLDPMGKCSNAFFSETTNMIKAKLYKFCVFCSGIQFQIEAPARLQAYV